MSETPEGTLPDFTNKLGMCGRLAITPGELGQLTNGAIDPIGNITIGLGQAAANRANEIKRYAKGLCEIPRLQIRKDIMMAPMLIMPNLEKDYLDRINKKKIML